MRRHWDYQIVAPGFQIQPDRHRRGDRDPPAREAERWRDARESLANEYRNNCAASIKSTCRRRRRSPSRVASLSDSLEARSADHRPPPVHRRTAAGGRRVLGSLAAAAPPPLLPAAFLLGCARLPDRHARVGAPRVAAAVSDDVSRGTRARRAHGGGALCTIRAQVKLRRVQGAGVASRCVQASVSARTRAVHDAAPHVAPTHVALTHRTHARCTHAPSTDSRGTPITAGCRAGRATGTATGG